MESTQEILFAAIFALLLVALAVYFAYLVRSAWRRVASVFFRIAVLTGCAWVWSLCAAGFAEYCGSWARHFHHTQIAYDLRQVSGIFLFLALGTFIISLAGFAIGITESLLRGHKPSNQSLEPTAGRFDGHI